MDKFEIESLNKIREKGVRYFEFSFTRPFRESSELPKKGLRLVVQFNYQEGTFGNVLDKITNILGKYPVIQLYASRKIGVLPFKGTTRPSDLNPCKYEGTAIFSILEDPTRFFLETDTIDRLEAVTPGLVINTYVSLSMWGSMPWSQ